MRGLDAVGNFRVEALDGVLQRAMRFIDSLQSARREAIEARVAATEKDLNSIAGSRFNMPDHDRMFDPRIQSLEMRAWSMEADRWTRMPQREPTRRMNDLQKKAERMHELQVEANSLKELDK